MTSITGQAGTPVSDGDAAETPHGTRRPGRSVGTLGLYVVHRGDAVGYDETAAYVAAAQDPDHARRLGRKASGDQDACVWWAPETAVTLIGTAASDVEPGIVISDFHAGWSP